MSHTVLQLVKLLFQKLLQKIMNASSLNYSPHAGFPFNLNFQASPWKTLNKLPHMRE